MMSASQDEFDRWLKSAGEVPFSSELQNRILQKAEELSDTLPETLPNDSRTSFAGRRRKRDFRSWLAGVGGVAAAILVGVAVWNSGVHQSGVLHQASTAHGVPALNTPEQQVQAVAANTIGLQQAPIRVVGLTTTSSTPSGPQNEVVATLVNTGTQPISKQDVFGVLSFHAGQSAGIASADWITFVDAPNQVLLPGQSEQWTFQPVTAPADGQGNLSELPSLSFYDTGTVPASQASTVWKLEPLNVTVSGVSVTKSWATGEAFQVQTTVKNTSNVAIPWNNLLAIIWFGGSDGLTGNVTDSGVPTAVSDFTQPGVSRYFTKVTAPDGQGDALQPGATTNLSFKLVGPVNPFLASLHPHVLVITEGGQQP